MTSNLYSASLGTRLTETLAYLATGSTVIDEFYPEGLRGSANAYAVLVGPSYGAYNGAGEQYPGGPNRPQSKWSKRLIGNGLGLNPFPDGSRVRQERWNRLLLACLLTPEAVQHLSALYNLDWGHYPDESSVPTSDLKRGAETVVEYLALARPKIVVPLSRAVWKHLVLALAASGSVVTRQDVIPEHQSLLIRLRGKGGLLDFETIVARPYNHPSWHFLTKKRIEAFGKGIAGLTAE
jgi:hypothetical protein